MNRGTCRNDLRVAREKVEALLLAGIRKDLFAPEPYQVFVKEFTKRWAERQRAQRPEKVEARRRLAKVEQEIANLMTAIKAGVVTRTTKTELERLEAEQVRLQNQIAGGTKPGNVVTLPPDPKSLYQRLVDKLGSLDPRFVDSAREQIKKLVGERITLSPTSGGYLVAELQGNYAGLLKLAANGSELKVKLFGCGGRI